MLSTCEFLKSYIKNKRKEKSDSTLSGMIIIMYWERKAQPIVPVPK